MKIRIIRTEDQYEMYLKRMEEIFDATGDSDESNELDLLALVIDKYESEKFPIKDVDPITLINFLIEQNGLSHGEFAKIIKSRSRVSEILNKKRKLNLNQIRYIKESFNISADLLVGDYELSV